MNYYDLEKHTKDIQPALVLDKAISPNTRRMFRKIFLILSVLVLIVDIFLVDPLHIMRGILALSACAHISLQLLEAMYRSYYFKKTTVDIRVLKILDTIKGKKDLTATFLTHEMGQYVMYRLGFSPKELAEFLQKKTDLVTVQEFEIIENDDGEVSFTEFGLSLLHFDSDLMQALRKKGVTVADFKQTLEWVSRMDKKVREQERWWLKDNLLRIPSIGKNLSFGQVYYLESYGHSIMNDSAYIQLGEKWRIYKSSVDKLESVLSKAVGANILLTAKESYICMDAVASLGKEILRGTILPSVENKRIYVLDANILISAYEEKTEFETMFQTVLAQAASAGNVILVIPNLPDFVENTHSLGTDVKDLLSEVLRSSNLQVIATSSERSFHEVLETDLDLMAHFDKVHLDEFDEFQAISLLEDEVLHAESREDVFFTYQAVKRIVESADRYFSDTSLSDKSIDILYEVIPVIKKRGGTMVTKEDVDELVTSKTGITLGKISKDESSKLSHLKEEMHKRVVGQESAIEAVCDAMLRARTGLANPKRPLGSFMFVGPTGVGKTETAKALAALFFGNEETMLRSDMSEYSDDQSVERMIGDASRAGIFASKVREIGHGVLLLDEFEKASSEVHDLFLQIIDEGFFTDGRGERVNMRNFIIIATSNAGSEMLYAQSAQNPVTKQQIIDHIIGTHVLRTELLNRFDDVILFQSLRTEQLGAIAHLMVERLAKRLDQRGITLKESPELIKYLVVVGNNPKFGAREMNRVIVKELESKIAQALVLGDLFEGDTIAFTVSGGNLEIQKYS
jgi:ATP-dependent Clp protease ATP-binding subunit ClpA